MPDAEAAQATQPPKEDSYPEIKTNVELSKRTLLSVDRVFWSRSKQQVVVQITSRHKMEGQLKLTDYLNVDNSGTMAYRRPTLLQALGKSEKHHVRLDLLGKMPKTSELFARFMTDLITEELKATGKGFTDPKKALVKTPA